MVQYIWVIVGEGAVMAVLAYLYYKERKRRIWSEMQAESDRNMVDSVIHVLVKNNRIL